jgi:hypothetical protein
MSESDAAGDGQKCSPAAWMPEIQELYARQVALTGDPHIQSHSNNPGVIRAHLRAIERYLPWVEGPRVLDWGCYHAPDSCVLRKVFGSGLEIHGCDPHPVNAEVFHRYAGLDFRKLDHHYLLPYPDAHFDTVVGSGVIEHVANHFETLKELHRVLRNGGQLILTFAPNQWSLTEQIQDCLGAQGHPRRYTRSGFRDLLLGHGFLIEELGYHEVAPTLSSPSVVKLRNIPGMSAMMTVVESLNPVLDHLWPLNVLGQNLYAIARRVDSIHGSHPRRTRRGIWRPGVPLFST